MGVERGEKNGVSKSRSLDGDEKGGGSRAVAVPFNYRGEGAWKKQRVSNKTKEKNSENYI